MKRYIPHVDVINALRDYGWTLRGQDHRELVNSVRWYLIESGDPIGWVLGAGVVAHARDTKSVLLRPAFFGLPERVQHSKYWHELVHVAQMRDDGLHRFRVRYAWQWIRSGFSYTKMKTTGYEKEAFAAERKFLEESP